MEAARSTGSFNRRITVADSNNIIAVLDMNVVNSEYQAFEKDYLVKFQSVLEDLKVTVGLLGLTEAPWPEISALMSESEKMAEIARIRTQGQKIGLGLYTAIRNGPWQYESEVVLQNQGGSETYVPILVPFLSSNETLLMAGNFKLGVRIEPKWNQPLKANDYLVVKGTWRQVVSFSKKNEDFSELAARIASLELALEGRLINLPANSLLGRNTNTGTVERIDRSAFKAADAELLDGINSDRFVIGDDWSRTLGGGLNDLNTLFSEHSGFIDAWGGGNLPPGISHINGFQVRHRNVAGLWGMQAGCQHNLANEFYFRTVTTLVVNQPSLFNPWRRIWNDGNYNPSSQTQVFTPTVKCFADSNPGTGLANTPATNVGFEIRAVSDGGAVIALHRPGRYAINFGLDTDNALAIGGWSAGATRFRIWHEAHGIPVWQAPSDARLKKQISPIKSALELIDECNPVRFKYNSEIKKSELYGSKKERDKFHYGFVAQDFPIGDLVYEKENGYLGIDYIETIPFLVGAIQELSEKIRLFSEGMPKTGALRALSRLDVGSV
jgi:hypothetical protein